MAAERRARGLAVPLLFWSLAALEHWRIGGALLGWILLAYPVARHRIRYYDRQDVDLKRRMETLDSHERDRAAGGE